MSKLKNSTIVSIFALLGIFYQTYLVYGLKSTSIPIEAIVLILNNIFGIIAAQSEKPILLNIFFALFAVAGVLSLFQIPKYSYPDETVQANQRGGDLGLPKLPGGNLIYILIGAYLYYTKR